MPVELILVQGPFVREDREKWPYGPKRLWVTIAGEPHLQSVWHKENNLVANGIQSACPNNRPGADPAFSITRPPAANLFLIFKSGDTYEWH
jgi:hypothetical protein